MDSVMQTAERAGGGCGLGPLCRIALGFTLGGAFTGVFVVMVAASQKCALLTKMGVKWW